MMGIDRIIYIPMVDNLILTPDFKHQTYKGEGAGRKSPVGHRDMTVIDGYLYGNGCSKCDDCFNCTETECHFNLAKERYGRK